MEDNTKKLSNNTLLFGLLASVAAVYLGSTLFNLNELSNELQIDQDVRIDPSSTLMAAKLRIHITLKNPTNGTITVKRPVTTIFFNDAEIGMSDTISDRDYVLPRFGQVTLEPYLVTVSVLNGSLAAIDFLRNLGRSRAIAIRARSLTMLGGEVPYSKETVIQLIK